MTHTDLYHLAKVLLAKFLPLNSYCLHFPSCGIFLSFAVCSYHTSSVYVLFFLLSEGETQFSIGFLNLKLISGAGSRCSRIMTFEVSRGTEAHLAPPLSRDPRPGPPASPSPLPVVTSPAPHGQAQVTIGSLCL